MSLADRCGVPLRVLPLTAVAGVVTDAPAEDDVVSRPVRMGVPIIAAAPDPPRRTN